MFNLQTLTAKARELLRGNVVKATTTKGTRTMTPVYEREEQRKLRERIQQTQPGGFYSGGILRPWQPAGVPATCATSVTPASTGKPALQQSSWRNQTKAAEARATRKGIQIVRQQRKDAARLGWRSHWNMHWDSVSCDGLAMPA